VDDALGAYDDDTTYISETTNNEEATFSFGAFSLTNMSSIKGVWVSALGRTDGTDSLGIIAVSPSGGTKTAIGSVALSAAYQWKGGSFPVDPNTSSAWASASAINSADFGVRRN
jgi:hypothetical protein